MKNLVRTLLGPSRLILPLIVSPCAFTMSEISDFQAVNNPEKTLTDLASDEAAIERAFLEVVKNIKDLV